MNEDNKDINEEFERADSSLNNQSDEDIVSQPSEVKSKDDQIALKVFKYFKEFIFCVAFCTPRRILHHQLPRRNI